MDAPSPALIFETLNGYQRSAALRAAIELDVFSAIARGENTASAIAKATCAAERGVRILCDFPHRHTDCSRRMASGAYGLTQDTALFLDRKSPAYMGGAVKFMHTDELFNSFDRLTDAVRKGGTASDVTGGTTAAEHPIWIEFARAMAPLMFMPSEQVAKLVDPDANKPIEVLDISASHGLWGWRSRGATPTRRSSALTGPRCWKSRRRRRRGLA
jgi:hypothetical protein